MVWLRDGILILSTNPFDKLPSTALGTGRTGWQKFLDRIKSDVTWFTGMAEALKKMGHREKNPVADRHRPWRPGSEPEPAFNLT